MLADGHAWPSSRIAENRRFCSVFADVFARPARAGLAKTAAHHQKHSTL